MIWFTIDFRRGIKKECRLLLLGPSTAVLGSAPVAVAEGMSSGGEEEQAEGMVERSDGRSMVETASEQDLEKRSEVGKGAPLREGVRVLRREPYAMSP